jgi:diaminopimelate epimerase
VKLRFSKYEGLGNDFLVVSEEEARGLGPRPPCACAIDTSASAATVS